MSVTTTNQQSSGEKAQVSRVKRRSADVRRQSRNNLNVLTVPILFVPGVMGSRLRFTDIDEWWDPNSGLKGGWRMTHWAFLSAASMKRDFHFENSPAVVETSESGMDASERGRNWGEIWNVYHGFLRAITSKSFAADCPVYACGYDWRQSNDKSAQTLVARIDEVLAKEGAQSLILITHSMGGLVARSACQSNSGLAKKVKGVIHVTQPVHGAPVAYRRFFTGATFSKDGFAMWLVLPNSGPQYAQVMSVLPGPMQLVPTSSYMDGGEPWLAKSEGDDRAPWSGDVFDLYKGSQYPPGLFNVDSFARGEVVRSAAASTSAGYNYVLAEAISEEAKKEGEKIKSDLRARIDEAKAFHSELGEFKHAETYSVLSTGLETDMATHFSIKEKSHRVEARRRKEGDGTVPSFSGAGLFPDQTSEPVCGSSDRQFAVRGATHDAACGNGQIQAAVDEWINSLVALRNK